MARCEQCSAEHATKKCGACKAVTYCSKECQKAHFRQHKKVCAQLAQGAFGVRLYYWFCQLWAPSSPAHFAGQ